MDAPNGRFYSGQFNDLEAFACGTRVGIAGDVLQATFNGLVLRDRRRQGPTLIADDLGSSVKGGTPAFATVAVAGNSAHARSCTSQSSVTMILSLRYAPARFIEGNPIPLNGRWDAQTG